MKGSAFLSIVAVAWVLVSPAGCGAQGSLISVDYRGLVARAGGPGRRANPWGAGDVTLYRNGKKAQDLSGATLLFPTGKGEIIVIVPQRTEPSRVKVP